MKRFNVNSAVLIFFLIFTSCAGPSERPRDLRGTFSRQLRHELVEALRVRNQRIRSLRGLATVRYGSKFFGAHGEAAVVIRRPSEIRIDALSEFGLNDSQLVASQGDLVIFWETDNRYFRGLASREHFARYLNVSLDPESVIRLMTGVVPVEAEEDYFLQTRKKGAEFFLKGRIGEVALEQRDSSYVPVRYTAYDVDGTRDYLVSYEDYREEGGTWFPNRLAARFWDPHLRVEILYHGVEINPAIDKKTFELKIPDDATLISD